jgi:uncharacterized membrane-anchored protein
MKNKTKIILVCVYLLALMAVPSFTILKSTQVLNKGEVFRFDILPLDPYDPFRGAYVTLRFQEQYVSVPNRNYLAGVEEVYLVLETQSDGFVKVIDALGDAQVDKSYLKTELRYGYPDSDEDSVKINIKYAFNRYYLNQKDAKLAEDALRFWNEERVEKAYVDVSILDGKGVIEELYFDDVPILEFLKND